MWAASRKKMTRVNEMAQWVRKFGDKPDNHSSIPGNHGVEEFN